MSGVVFLSSLPKSANEDFTYSNPATSFCIDQSFKTEGKFTIFADTVFVEKNAIIDAERIDITVRNHFIGINAQPQQLSYRVAGSIVTGSGLFEWGPLSEKAKNVVEDKFGHIPA